jgi:hypothetical protein
MVVHGLPRIACLLLGCLFEVAILLLLDGRSWLRRLQNGIADSTMTLGQELVVVGRYLSKTVLLRHLGLFIVAINEIIKLLRTPQAILVIHLLKAPRCDGCRLVCAVSDLNLLMAAVGLQVLL